MKKRLFLCLLIIISLIITKSVYAETYDGEYNVEYLLKNYNVVTLGVRDNSNDVLYDPVNDKKGRVLNITSIDGAILINGDYTSTKNSTFGSQAGNTKSFIKGTKGNNVSTTSSLVTDPNYIDFNKLYENVLLTSEYLINNTEYHLQGIELEVSKPGIYTVDNVPTYYSTPNDGGSNNILIKNYDNSSLYVFNFYNEYVTSLPEIVIMLEGASNVISLPDFINSGNYTGNIILNFPKAKIIDLCNMSGNLIAPNAVIHFYSNYSNYSYASSGWQHRSNYYGTIIANTISGFDRDSSHNDAINYIIKTNYSINDSLLKKAEPYIVNAKEYTDDKYTRDYSIKDLLQNYNLITLGHKQINTKSKINVYSQNPKPGSIRLFHITGQFMISGDALSKVYENELDDYLTFYGDGYSYEYQKFDRTAVDLESREVTESTVKGNSFIRVVYTYSGSYSTNTYPSNQPIVIPQTWDSMANDNKVFYGGKNIAFNSNYYSSVDNYINFDRLYNNIVAEQSGIEAGKTLTANSDGILHIPTGGTYTIEDISNVKEIVFDNFEKNEDELTIITIKNGGDINFPLVSKDGNGYKGIVTNDYFGKEQANHLYELDTFLSEDSYYGNIVWNLPNADYIKLAENAPFAGHMIAPNADVETPELHFAGCFIVNSIYGEGNTEAHFYPINSNLKCVSHEYDSLSETQKKKFNDYRLRKTLGGDKTTIEKEIIGDKAQYDKDVALFESLILKCENREIIVNPKTAGTIAILFGIMSLAFIGLFLRKKKVQ